MKRIRQYSGWFLPRFLLRVSGLIGFCKLYFWKPFSPGWWALVSGRELPAASTHAPPAFSIPASRAASPCTHSQEHRDVG